MLPDGPHIGEVLVRVGGDHLAGMLEPEAVTISTRVLAGDDVVVGHDQPGRLDDDAAAQPEAGLDLDDGRGGGADRVLEVGFRCRCRRPGSRRLQHAAASTSRRDPEEMRSAAPTPRQPRARRGSPRRGVETSACVGRGWAVGGLTDDGVGLDGRIFGAALGRSTRGSPGSSAARASGRSAIGGRSPAWRFGRGGSGGSGVVTSEVVPAIPESGIWEMCCPRLRRRITDRLGPMGADVARWSANASARVARWAARGRL